MLGLGLLQQKPESCNIPVITEKLTVLGSLTQCARIQKPCYLVYILNSNPFNHVEVAVISNYDALQGSMQSPTPPSILIHLRQAGGSSRRSSGHEGGCPRNAGLLTRNLT